MGERLTGMVRVCELEGQVTRTERSEGRGPGSQAAGRRETVTVRRSPSRRGADTCGEKQRSEAAAVKRHNAGQETDDIDEITKESLMRSSD